MSIPMSESYMSGKPAVALNGVYMVSVHGLAADNDGTPVKLEIKRTAPDSSKKRCYEVPAGEHATLIDEIPTSPQSCLPPDGNARLELRIGDVLGQNDRNVVYAVRVMNADKIACYVPPLVVKVARLYKGRNVSEEAGMYQDLECLQGSIIPRCYGYYCATIDHAQVYVLPWDGPDFQYPRTFDSHYPPHPAAPLSMMLLERLGDPIPTGSWVESEAMKQELLDIHDERARFGMYEIDWRLGNLLYAPPSPPGLPGTPSPNHNHLYSIRLFDFEFSMRINSPPEFLNHEAEVHIENLVYEIAYRRSHHLTHLPSVRWKGVVSE